MEAGERFAGRVAFITGAARGQGRAEALRLATEGARIVAVDSCADPVTTAYRGPTPADLDDTAAAVRACGTQVITRIADVRDLDALQDAWAEGADALGAIDIVIANAGICSASRLWETTTAQWEETLAVNLTGVFHTFRVAAPAMIRQQRGGSIIATSSTAGLKGLPFLSAYAAAKHGVVGLVRTLANELAEYGIRVNSVHPTGVATGMVLTDLAAMVEESPAHIRSMFLNAMPDPPVVTPDDVAAVVAWLASDDARYITGAQIPVDLGMLTR
jgi:SDR family mycofactocin-dependent oxidoreductase